MEAYQWFLLGIMVAWTPCLVVLALMLNGQAFGTTLTDDSRCLLLRR
jgi:hypothetical protein